MKSDLDSMSPTASIRHLLQLDIVEEMLPSIGKKQWQILYRDGNVSPRGPSVWCALLDPSAVEAAMDSDCWDLHIGDGMPAFSQSSRCLATQQLPTIDSEVPMASDRFYCIARFMGPFRSIWNLARNSDITAIWLKTESAD